MTFQKRNYQYLTNVQSCYRQFGRQTIYPTQNEFVSNALRDNIGLKKSASILKKNK